MAKVDIISGFLGAGKTTLIKKLLKDSSLKDEQVVLIENEFGEIGIDGGFMRDAGIQVNELSQGCICCSLVGDFEKALKQVLDTYHPDRIIIEPSGVGKLSDIIAAVETVHSDELQLDAFYTVVDAKKCKMYHKNFGEFFNNQIANASVVVLSRTQDVDEDKLKTDLDIVRELNDHAAVVTTPWDEISGEAILEAANDTESLKKALLQAEEEHEEEHGEHHHHHHHHHHEHEHHHDHEHHHHHHDHDHEESGAAIEEEGSKAYFDEEDLHDADEVFNSIGVETAHAFTKEELEEKLNTLTNDDSLGNIIRSKGIVKGTEGKWYEFDYVAGDYEIRECKPDFGGRLCVIGENIDAHKLYDLMKG